MTKKEFIKACVELGYSSAKVAKMYCKDKEALTENDFIEVYRLVERKRELSSVYNNKFRDYAGVRTTKRFKQSGKMGSDKYE